MIKHFGSFWFTDNIWALLPECSVNGDELIPFNGEIDTSHVTEEQLRQVEYLIIGIALYEPQLKGNYTSWINNSLKYCKESNMFPNLKSVYILYESAKIDFSKLIDYYPIHGGRTRYFLLRSDKTEEKAIGLEPKKWIDHNNKKAIFMLGDITNRLHKFPLLYKFHNENKLDYLDYSLTYILNDNNAEGSHQFQSHNYNILIELLNKIYDLDLNVDSMKSLYYEFARKLPGDKFGEMAAKQLQAFDLANYVFPPAWNDTSLVINPETWWRHPITEENRYPEDAMIFPMTEKTWKPIATKKPFISISVNDVFDRTLESLGFRTFRKYTKHPELIDIPVGYTDPNAVEKYLTITYERVVSFIDNLEENKHQIWDDVEYNHAHWHKVLEREWDLLIQHCLPLKHVPREKILRAFIVCYPNDINLKESYQNPLTFGF